MSTKSALINPALNHETEREYVMVYASFILLLISCVNDDLASNVAKCLWLLSMAIVSTTNIGAALGIYVASVAIYSPIHYEGQGTLLQRPDNYALAIFFVSFFLNNLTKLSLKNTNYSGLTIALFLIYALGQSVFLGLLTIGRFAWFMRTFGLSMVIYVMIACSPVSKKEIESFFEVIIILGIYMVLISLMEWLRLFEFLIPPWIGNPRLNWRLGEGRSGGLLLQPEYNGLTLGLISCVALGSGIAKGILQRILKYGAALFCLVGVLLTYSRGAWISAASAFLLLQFRQIDARWRVLKRIGIISLATLAVLLLVIFPSKMMKQRASDADTVYFRLNLWAAGLSMVADRPLFGHGFGQFEEEISKYHSAVGSLPDTPVSSVAHNIFLSVLIEHGVIGFCLYVLINIQIYRKAMNSIPLLWPKSGRIWVTGFMLVYFLNGQFVHLQEATSNLLVYGTMGLLSGLANRT
jgi:hypothetical protein